MLYKVFGFCYYKREKNISYTSCKNPAFKVSQTHIFSQTHQQWAKCILRQAQREGSRSTQVLLQYLAPSWCSTNIYKPDKQNKNEFHERQRGITGRAQLGGPVLSANFNTSWQQDLHRPPPRTLWTQPRVLTQQRPSRHGCEKQMREVFLWQYFYHLLICANRSLWFNL